MTCNTNKDSARMSYLAEAFLGRAPLLSDFFRRTLSGWRGCLVILNPHFSTHSKDVSKRISDRIEERVSYYIFEPKKSVVSLSDFG